MSPTITADQSKHLGAIVSQIAAEVSELKLRLEKDGHKPNGVVLGYIVNAHLGRPVFGAGALICELPVLSQTDPNPHGITVGCDDSTQLSTSW